VSNEHFNLIAGLYDRTARFTPSQALLRALDLPVQGLLLDAGGGTGRVAAGLRTLVGGVVVADVSRGMMKYAREKDLDCVHAPAESLPFASETFDRIVMLDALHHVHRQELTLAELSRTLKPGGRLVIIEPDIHRFAVRLVALAEKLMLMRSRFLSGEKIAELLSKSDTKVRVEFEEANVWVVAEK
jgi:demethylmenaquinone methyltransferase/2-methoxy-6-polyprenyl-1,4-benzoquinol methylase